MLMFMQPKKANKDKWGARVAVAGGGVAALAPLAMALDLDDRAISAVNNVNVPSATGMLTTSSNGLLGGVRGFGKFNGKRQRHSQHVLHVAVPVRV